MRQNLVPRVIAPGARRLGQIAEHGEGSRRRPPGHHPELHRAQILGLVHHYVSVRPGPPVDEELRFVEQGEVVGCPRLRSHTFPFGTQQAPPFGLREDTPGGEPEALGTGEEIAQQCRRGDRGPQVVEQILETVGGRQLAVEPGLVGLESAGGPELLPGQPDQP